MGIRLIFLGLCLTFYNISASPIAKKEPPRFEIDGHPEKDGHPETHRDGHEDHDFEETSKHYLKKREVSKMDGHDKKVDGHEDEFSQELMPYKHNLNKRGVARIDPMEFDINNEFELDAERVEMMPNEQDEKAKVEAARVEAENNQAMEAKLLADGEKAFQAFDKNINEAIKQNEAVEKEIKNDIDEQ